MGEVATAPYKYETDRGIPERPSQKSASNVNIAKRWCLATRALQTENIIDPYAEADRWFGREDRRLRSSFRVASLAGTFKQLATQWRNETKFLSSITDKVLHPCYQRIIGLGPDAIPIILLELRKRGEHWFWALESITGENPVLPEHYGDIENMAHDWIEWGKRKGYLI
jgi:hypothetical protein